MMQQGFKLALSGMSTVFLFLFLLIICMTLMSKTIAFFEQPSPQTSIISKSEKELSLSRSQIIPDELLIAVISTVIQQHRSKPNS